MQNEYLILISLYFLVSGCSTTSKVQYPGQTYSYRISLANTEFFDGTIYLTEEIYTKSYSYKFGDHTYEKFVNAHDQRPFKIYLMESGLFELDELSLTLMPTIKIRCKLEGLLENISCESMGSYEDHFYVNRDTLDELEIEEMEFHPRETEILFENKKMVFKDPIMPSYIQFQQIIR